jgi:LysR family glycine cleavage system transcriptional activator
MSKRLPPLNWLRSFQVSAKHLSFTKAALELGLTQSAVSQQVKGLEAQLDVSLFKRLPRGLELTEIGKSYIPVVNESIQRLIVATDELFALNNQSSISIKVSLVFLTHWLVPRIADFYEQHPNIKLKFSSFVWQENEIQDTDLEIRHGLGKWPGFSANRLSFDDLVPVCSPAYYEKLNTRFMPFSLKNISQCQLINVIGYNEGWGYWLNEFNIKNINIEQYLQLDSLIPALELAVQGKGMALGRSCLIEHLLNKKLLIAPFSERKETNEAFYLIEKKNRNTQNSTIIFRTWLLDQVESDGGAAKLS